MFLPVSLGVSIGDFSLELDKSELSSIGSIGGSSVGTIQTAQQVVGIAITHKA